MADVIWKMTTSELIPGGPVQKLTLAKGTMVTGLGVFNEPLLGELPDGVKEQHIVIAQQLISIADNFANAFMETKPVAWAEKTGIPFSVAKPTNWLGLSNFGLYPGRDIEKLFNRHEYHAAMNRGRNLLVVQEAPKLVFTTRGSEDHRIYGHDLIALNTENPSTQEAGLRSEDQLKELLGLSREIIFLAGNAITRQANNKKINARMSAVSPETLAIAALSKKAQGTVLADF